MPVQGVATGRKLPPGTIAVPSRVKDRPQTNQVNRVAPVMPNQVRSRIMEPAIYPPNATQEQKELIDMEREEELAQATAEYFAYPRSNNPDWRLRIRIGMDIWWYRKGNTGAEPSRATILAIVGDTIGCVVWGQNKLEHKQDCYHVSHKNALDPRKVGRDSVGSWDFIPTPEREAISNLEARCADMQSMIDELLSRLPPVTA